MSAMAVSGCVCKSGVISQVKKAATVHVRGDFARSTCIEQVLQGEYGVSHGLVGCADVSTGRCLRGDENRRKKQRENGGGLEPFCHAAVVFLGRNNDDGVKG